MKNIDSLIIALIVACSTGLYAQEEGTETVRANNPPTESLGLIHSGEYDSWVELKQIGSRNLTVTIEIPEVYRICCRTNDVTHHPSSDWTPPDDMIIATAENWIDSSPLAGTERDNLALPDAIHQPSLLPASTPVKSLFSTLAEEDVYDWMFAISTNKPPKNKNGTELIATSNSPNMPEAADYALFITPPKHTWYEWINPELFLMQWAEYWFNGSPTDNTTHWAESRINDPHPENARMIVLMQASF